MLLTRLLLLGRGTLSDYDERRYLQSFAAVRAAVHGNWHAVAYDLSMTDARPLDALWRCLPAAVQLALHRWAGWSLFGYPTLLVPTGLNWVATVLTACFFYRISQRLLADLPASTSWALVVAVLYASLANTSLYVRHVAPYDGALLLFMGLLAWVLRQPPGPRGWFWMKLGLGAGLLWLTYPGYYAGPVLLVAPLLDWRRPLPWVVQHAGRLLLLGAGFALPLLVAEGLSRLGGAPPFWAVSYDLSLHILQGSPEEGYTFAFKYLWQVESWLGIALLGLLAVALWQAARAMMQVGWVALVPSAPRQRLLLAAALLFLAHASAAALGHRIVWYGRLLHLYLPWLVLAAVVPLARSRATWATALAIAACLLGVVHYGQFFHDFQQLVYPPDLVARYHLGCLPPTQLRYYTEVKVANDLLYPVQGAGMPAPEACPPARATADSVTVLVNFALLYPLTAATRQPAYLPKPTARQLLEQPYFGSFPAYRFEGLSPAERTEAIQRQFKLRILREPAAVK
ncbi:hypothetical protein HHL22_22830 [Hymenobacter sp. RP-2-7]|uniref:Glycosyltransferase RgtA/B/C/D-like domain-containing protein n=1 Tax=Hymenobacter polaris TaxID=2682546 RepID=A0A7Y0AIM7_9BACT|nr:hypothetical protein [Hymenobacter polaris]NML68043.1 hypothetical protein [Hymenobacter polaris]